MKSSVLPLLCAVALVAACADRETADPSVSKTSSASLSAYLTTSSAVSVAGDDVTVDFRVQRGPDAPLVGSYLIDILLDTSGVKFLQATATEGMVAGNLIGGGIRVAGATGDGFQSDRLASVTFKARNPAILETMQLRVAELNSTSYRDQRAVVTVSPRVLGAVHRAAK